MFKPIKIKKKIAVRVLTREYFIELCDRFAKEADKGRKMENNTTRRIIILLFFLSGFCNLAYEIVWARMFNLVFGVTVFAVSAVLSAFMLGLAAGGIIFGRMAEKSNNRILLFSIIHIGISLSAVSVLLLFPVLKPLFLYVHKFINPGFYLFRSVIFLFSLLLLIIPTTLMGATFPVAGRIVTKNVESMGKKIGILYSVNTLGSVIGCVTTIFFLLGFAGMKGTIYLAAFLDLAIGLAAMLIDRIRPQGEKNR